MEIRPFAWQMALRADVWVVEVMGIAQSLRQSVSLKFVEYVALRITAAAVVLRHCV